MYHIAVHHADIEPKETTVRYRSTPVISKQTHLKGRTVFVPEISLARYKAKAVIDFVVIEVQLAWKTQGQHLHRFLAEWITKSFKAEPLDKNPIGIDSRSTENFLVTFQEADLRRIELALDAAAVKYGFKAEPIIRELEVSVDFYSKLSNARERRLMTAILMRHLFPPQQMIAEVLGRQRYWDAGLAKQQRQTAKVASILKKQPAPIPAQFTFSGLGSKFNSSQLILDQTRIKPLKLDATMYFGKKKNAPSRMRVMDKVSDNEDKATHEREPLILEKCRARVEVTLDRFELTKLKDGKTGKEGGHSGTFTFEDLRAFSFGKLQGRYFRFMLPTFSVGGTKPLNFEQIRKRLRENDLPELFLKTSVITIYEVENYLAELDQRLIKRRRTSKIGRRSQVFGDRGNLIAYDELNSVVRAALNRLSLRTF